MDRFILDDLPWKLLWSEFCIEVYKLQLEAMQLSLAAISRHQIKTEAKQQKDWSTGTDFKNRFQKSWVKAAIMAELERVKDKHLTVIKVSGSTKIKPFESFFVYTSSDARYQ